MKYIKEINRLGGIKSLYIEENRISINELNELESNFTRRLPLDYKDFILKNSVCSFNALVFFNALNNEPEYIYPREYNFPIYNFNFSSIGVFFSKDKDVYDINWNIKNYKDRIPPDMLPIFTDGVGNLGLLSLQNAEYGKIYFWDHEYEWDADDYYEEIGVEMPEKAKFQNLWLIGYNFTDFLSRCYIQ